MSSPEEPGALAQPFQGVWAEAVAAGALGVVFGGPAAAIAGLGAPFLARALELSVRELGAQRHRVEAMWAVATANVDPAEFLAAADSDADRRHLAFTAAEAAGRSRFSGRVVALGRALAAGVLATDAARLDHEQFVVDALSALDRPHLVVLSSMVSHQIQLDRPYTPQWEWSHIASRLPAGYEPSLPPVLATLEARGLVTRVDRPRSQSIEDVGNPVAFWNVNDFGLAVLAALRAAGTGVHDGLREAQNS